MCFIIEIDPAIVGAEGIGYRYEAPAESDEEMEDLAAELDKEDLEHLQEDPC